MSSKDPYPITRLNVPDEKLNSDPEVRAYLDFVRDKLNGEIDWEEHKKKVLDELSKDLFE